MVLAGEGGEHVLGLLGMTLALERYSFIKDEHGFAIQQEIGGVEGNSMLVQDQFLIGFVHLLPLLPNLGGQL